jgi:hypothetical protein
MKSRYRDKRFIRSYRRNLKNVDEVLTFFERLLIKLILPSVNCKNPFEAIRLDNMESLWYVYHLWIKRKKKLIRS